jgi:hypothetical protein
VSYILAQGNGATVRVRVRGNLKASIALAREWARLSRREVLIWEGEPFAGVTLVYYRVNKHGALFAPSNGPPGSPAWRAVH